MGKSSCWCCLPWLFSSLCKRGEKAVDILMCGCEALPQLKTCQGLSYNKSVEQALVEGTFVSNSLNLLRDNEKALFLLGFPIW